jgi:hypothetical protein
MRRSEKTHGALKNSLIFFTVSGKTSNVYTVA